MDRDVEASMNLVTAWRSADKWQFGLEAATWLVASEVGSGQTPQTGSGSVGYGLADELRDHLEHPAVERLALLAGRRTRWDPLRGADRSAGRARITSDTAVTPPLPQSEIREALTVAPWPANEAQFVTAKEPAVITVPTGDPVTAAAWCQPLRLGEGGKDPGCTVVLSVDGVGVRQASVGPNQLLELATPALAAGRHDIQVAIDDPGRTNALSVRFRSSSAGPSGAPLRPLRDTAAFAATPQQPFSIAVAGPATVFLELRGLADAGGMVDVVATGPDGAQPTRTVVLPAVADKTITLSSGVSASAGLPGVLRVVVPTSGTWTVAVTPRSGATLVRGALRQETPAPTVQRPGPMWRDISADSEPFDWPAVTPTSGEVNAGTNPMYWGVGTFSAGVGFGRQDLEQQGGAVGTSADELETSLAWRVQALPHRLWLHVEPAFRSFAGTSSAGVSGDALLRLLGPDLRFLTSGQYFAQSGASAFEAGLRVYRPFRLGNGAFLIPSLEGVGAPRASTRPPWA
jgi:hypothetical protein